MESLSISDEVYDRTHSFVGKDGEIVLPPGPTPSTTERDASDTHSDDEQATGEMSKRPLPKMNTSLISIYERDANDTHSGDEQAAGEMIKRRLPKMDTGLKSIYLANGLHHQLTEDDFQVLPERFQSGSTKARITWFGALCMAGIGMFVEAYIIITTVSQSFCWVCYYYSFSCYKIIV